LYMYKFSMKPGAPSLFFLRQFDQVRERNRYPNYSLKTKNGYLNWIRFLFV